MKPTHKLVLLMLAAAAALAIAGCGGGDGDATDTAAATTEEPQGLTKAELIEQGDAICAEVNAAVGILGLEAEEAAVPDTIEKSTNLFMGMLQRLQELGTPVDDDGSYARFMEAAEQFAKIEADLKLAAEREDPGALGEAATEAAPALEEFRAQAEIYGFQECSQDAVPPSSASGESAPEGEEFEGAEEEGGVEAEPEYVEPEAEEEAPEEPAPETGGAGGGTAPEAGGGESGGSESGGVGPG